MEVLVEVACPGLAQIATGLNLGPSYVVVCGANGIET